MMEKHRIAVFGAGYIGLVTGACFAKLGHDVVVRDIQKERVEILQNGGVPIYEAGLAELIAENADRLRFTLDAEEAVRDSDVVYVCVDTPSTLSGDADLSRIWQVIDTLGEARHLAAVVVKSTVPVGTGARVRAAMDQAGLQHVGYASNPEFTAEGQAVRDFLQPDRVVIGADDSRTAKLVAQLHEGVGGPVVEMDVPSAEMVKLAANALLATKISFTNEIATVCEATGADVEQVVHAVGLDHRLGPHYMKAGVGWGGSCFPKDSRALRAMASNSGYSFQMLSSVIEVNDLQPRRAVQRLKDELDGTLRDRTIALLGITFKPGTDDVREAPSTILASRLLAEGAAVRCWDPLARPLATAPWSSATRYATPLEAMTGVDAVVIVTDWPELRDVDWDQAAAVMARPLMFDGRNLLEPQRMGSLGFTYMSVGRRTVRGA
ncbi:UDP-glucose dehydrogenase family protein [Streptomyces violascens]|uniref:UDP-glucose 6-dehydrogenase n=1 Tax=Streptomyces violascens TaxID=67381 RepID=A0ABQ3QL12_9ACTN|nr:UDP-glucose/GDP-mannose dehydrogenase family protein [Streptomyces violascens]GGU44737.1 UDP-glucose 6-dehydrogenase TuaD [Streptomyces violascens]GHI37970.1 UDP-glucose 6-dehydrogenase TuaD [Streptomyces violascens]